MITERVSVVVAVVLLDANAEAELLGEDVALREGRDVTVCVGVAELVDVGRQVDVDVGLIV